MKIKPQTMQWVKCMPTAVHEHLWRIVCFIAVCGACLASVVQAEEKTLAQYLAESATLEFCGEAVPLDLPQVRERFEKEMLLTLWDRPQVLLWIKRASRYMPVITQQLNARGMPEDLKYLAVAESALRPHAGSSKGAVGFWQLMPETARKYGLTVNEFVDQRRNIFLSTPAALAYLTILHEKFSSWTMAVAAYNMGEEGLTAEVLEQNTKDYYNLYLSLETQRFVLRVLAVKLILDNPQKYGFRLRPQETYPPLVFDTVQLDCFQELPIRLIAEASGTYFKTIKDLNPQLRGHYVQAGHHQISVPQGSASGFQKRFDALVSRFQTTRQKRIYIVRNGDSLSAIAEKFEVPLGAILIWNRLNLSRPIHPGDRLVVYPRRLEKIQ